MRISDWSSDVCSSDLGRGFESGCRRLVFHHGRRVPIDAIRSQPHQSVGRRIAPMQVIMQHLTAPNEIAPRIEAGTFAVQPASALANGDVLKIEAVDPALDGVLRELPTAPQEVLRAVHRHKELLLWS